MNDDHLRTRLFCCSKNQIFETLDGLKAEDGNGKLHFLPDCKECICRPFRQLSAGAW